MFKYGRRLRYVKVVSQSWIRRGIFLEQENDKDDDKEDNELKNLTSTYPWITKQWWVFLKNTGSFFFFLLIFLYYPKFSLNNTFLSLDSTQTSCKYQLKVLGCLITYNYDTCDNAKQFIVFINKAKRAMKNTILVTAILSQVKVLYFKQWSLAKENGRPY